MLTNWAKITNRPQFQNATVFTPQTQITTMKNDKNPTTQQPTNSANSTQTVAPTQPQLDTDTTFADMNVEGLPWYDKNKKQGKQKVTVTKKEFWKMVGGAFSAYLPLIGVLACVGVIIYCIARLWMG